jgi:predicted nucleic acid-binding protein
VTTTTVSETFLVDSSGWVQYLGDGPKAEAFGKYLENEQTIILPTIIVYEVYKKLLRELSHTLAERFLSQAFGFRERVIPLGLALAALAAKISLETNLPMADAIIYATAQSNRAELITSDAHFAGLPGVTVL